MRNPIQLQAALAGMLASTLILTEPKKISRTKEPDAITRLVDYTTSQVKLPPKLSEQDHIRIEKAEAKRQRKAEKRIAEKFEI